MSLVRVSSGPPSNFCFQKLWHINFFIHSCFWWCHHMKDLWKNTIRLKSINNRHLIRKRQLLLNNRSWTSLFQKRVGVLQIHAKMISESQPNSYLMAGFVEYIASFNLNHLLRLLASKIINVTVQKFKKESRSYKRGPSAISRLNDLLHMGLGIIDLFRQLSPRFKISVVWVRKVFTKCDAFL